MGNWPNPLDLAYWFAVLFVGAAMWVRGGDARRISAGTVVFCTFVSAMFGTPVNGRDVGALTIAIVTDLPVIAVLFYFALRDGATWSICAAGLALNGAIITFAVSWPGITGGVVTQDTYMLGATLFRVFTYAALLSMFLGARQRERQGSAT